MEALKDLKNSNSINKDLFDRLKPTNSTAPRFYGLPKIHKPDIPLRPIVAAIGSPTFSLAKFVTSVISPLVGNTSSYVRNSTHFRDMILKETIDRSEMMVSFDVKSLFTNVPIDAVLKITKKRLDDDTTLQDRSTLTPDEIIKLLRVCLTTTYFQYDGEFYEQLDGAAMGSPVSPVIANIFMEHFESLAVDSTVRFWRRYVDDIFCFIKRDKVQGTLDHLNSFFSSISFTVEEEQEGCLPFLDVMVKRNHNGTFTTSVYRKPTHSDRYLAYHSNHAPHVKRGVIKCLLDRAYNLCDASSLPAEISHVKRVLQHNGYPRHLINRVDSNRTRNNSTSSEFKPLSTAVIPYIPNLGERLRKILWEYDIRTAFKSNTTLSTMLSSAKDKPKQEDKIRCVYKVCCTCGDHYIGESGRKLGTRIKEHNMSN